MDSGDRMKAKLKIELTIKVEEESFNLDQIRNIIRKYLKEETEIEIQTIHGVGFRFINPSAKVEEE